MGKKKAASTKAKKTTKKKVTPSKPKTAKTKAKPPTTCKRKPSAGKVKVAKAATSRARKPKPPEGSLMSVLDNFNRIKAVLGELTDEELHNLWLLVYGYGDEVTEEDVPDDPEVLLGHLADVVLELQPSSDDMTPRKLANMIGDAY